MKYIDIPKGYKVDYESSTDTKLALVPCYDQNGISNVVKYILDGTNQISLINNLTYTNGTNEYVGVAPDDVHRDLIDEVIKMAFLIKYCNLAYYDPNRKEDNCRMTFRLFKTEITDPRNGNDYTRFILKAVPVQVGDNYNLFNVRSKTAAEYVLKNYGDKLKNLLVGLQHMFNMKIE